MLGSVCGVVVVVVVVDWIGGLEGWWAGGLVGWWVGDLVSNSQTLQCSIMCVVGVCVVCSV